MEKENKTPFGRQDISFSKIVSNGIDTDKAIRFLQMVGWNARRIDTRKYFSFILLINMPGKELFFCTEVVPLLGRDGTKKQTQGG